MWQNKYVADLCSNIIMLMKCISSYTDFSKEIMNLRFPFQCLQALQKISCEQPLACLQSGAIMAVLSYIDFFATSVQVYYSYIDIKYSSL